MHPELIATAGGCVTNTISVRLSVRNNDHFFLYYDNIICPFRQLKKMSNSMLI